MSSINQKWLTLEEEIQQSEKEDISTCKGLAKMKAGAWRKAKLFVEMQAEDLNRLRDLIFTDKRFQGTAGIDKFIRHAFREMYRHNLGDPFQLIAGIASGKLRREAWLADGMAAVLIARARTGKRARIPAADTDTPRVPLEPQSKDDEIRILRIELQKAKNEIAVLKQKHASALRAIAEIRRMSKEVSR